MLQNNLPGFNQEDNKKIYCSLRDASQTVANGSTDTIGFSTKDDPYNLATQISVGKYNNIVIPKTAMYVVSGRILFASVGAAGARFVNISTSREGNIAQNQLGPNANGYGTMSIVRVLKLYKGDVVSLLAGQTSGGNLSLGTDPYTQSFEIWEL